MSPNKNLILWTMPCVVEQDPNKKALWESKHESICTDYDLFFGFWEEEVLKNSKNDTISVFSSTIEKMIRFNFNIANKNKYVFTLDLTYLYLPTNTIHTSTLLKIEIPTYKNQHSRPIIWRELENSIRYKNIPISNVLYNTIDTNKENLRILLKLLNVYHESLNIFTMQRLSGIPHTEVLLYENGQKENLIKWITTWTHVDEKILNEYNVKQLKHMTTILQKKIYKTSPTI